MAQGTVKWFHPLMGYGFITPDDGSAGVLLPALTSQRERPGRLRRGARVEYEAAPGRDGRPVAVDMRLTDGDRPPGAAAVAAPPAAVPPKTGRRGA